MNIGPWPWPYGPWPGSWPGWGNRGEGLRTAVRLISPPRQDGYRPPPGDPSPPLTSIMGMGVNILPTVGGILDFVCVELIHCFLEAGVYALNQLIRVRFGALGLSTSFCFAVGMFMVTLTNPG